MAEEKMGKGRSGHGSSDGAAAPLISVVLPMDGDPRGGPANLRSWARQSGLEPGEFEILVGHGGAPEERVREMRAALREWDEVFRLEPGNPERRTVSEMKIYDAASRRARGRWILFTEDHVVAEPGCLEEVRRAIAERPDLPGFSLGCGHIGADPLARAEGLHFDASLAHWQQTNCWNRVRIRGTVIRRDIYEAIGGMPGEYGLFGEAILAARLHAAGHRLDYLPGARIRHINTSTLVLMSEHVGDYVQGQCRYHDAEPASEAARLTGLTDEMVFRDWLQPGPSRRFWRALGALEQATPVAGKGAAWEILRSLRRSAGLTAILGSRPRIWRDRFRVHRAHRPFRLGRVGDDDAVGRLQLLWDRIRTAVQAEYLALHPGPAGAAPLGGAAGLSLDASALHYGVTTGFYERETLPDGRAFRWTSPVARLLLSLDPGHYHLRLDTGGLRPDLAGVPLGLFWNDRMIPPDQVKRSATGVRFKVDRRDFRPGTPQELMVVCAPLGSAGDHRLLGLPVLSLEAAVRNPLSRARASSPQPASPA